MPDQPPAQCSPISTVIPGSWKQLSFPVSGNLVDAAGDLLESLGSLAVSNLSADGEDRFDIAEPTLEKWSVTKISALFDQAADLDRVIDEICRILPVDRSGIEVEQIHNQDWERTWLDNFQPIEIASNLWICPSWCEPPVAGAVNLVLDPGLAFGTGTHATTALCLRRLAAMNLSGRTVLDFGCGSGILAIAALLLGASTALATDIDPRALDATRENARVNGVLERLDVLPAAAVNEAIGGGQIRADVVIANILAPTLIELSGLLRQSMAPGARLLLSGILKGQSHQVCEAYPGLRFEAESREDWILLDNS